MWVKSSGRGHSLAHHCNGQPVAQAIVGEAGGQGEDGGCGQATCAVPGEGTDVIAVGVFGQELSASGPGIGVRAPFAHRGGGQALGGVISSRMALDGPG